jgi:hypothetical protein
MKALYKGNYYYIMNGTEKVLVGREVSDLYSLKSIDREGL